MEHAPNQIIKGHGAGEHPRTSWRLQPESGSGGPAGCNAICKDLANKVNSAICKDLANKVSSAICKDLANKVNSAIPKAADDTLAKRMVKILSEFLLKALLTALESAPRAVKDTTHQTKEKHTPPNATKQVSATAIAGHLVERMRQDLSRAIDNAIELCVRITWGEYATGPLQNIFLQALGEKTPSRRTVGFVGALREYDLDRLSLKFVPQEVRDALGSAINKSMPEIAHVRIADTPGVSIYAIEDVLRRNFQTTLIPVIKDFGKCAPRSVAHVACAVAAEVMDDGNGDQHTKLNSAWALDGDGDVVMGGC